MKTHTVLPQCLRFALLAVSSVMLSGGLSAQIDGDWITTAGGNWSDAVNWSSDPQVPGGAGSEVSINAALGSDATITLDSVSRTVGILNIGREAAGGIRDYGLVSQNGAVLQFDNGGFPAQLNYSAFSADDSLILPIELSSSLEIRNQSDGFKTIGGVDAPVTSATAGLKTISNLGDGSWRVWLRNVGDGAGTVAVVQDSATSDLILGASGVTNSFTGGVTVNSGRLWTGGTDPFGAASGVVTLNSGIVNNSGSSTSSIANPVTINGDITLSDSIGGTGILNFTGAITLSGDRAITIASGRQADMANIGDDGDGYALTKRGGGTLFLGTGDTATYTGGTVIEEGFFRVAGTGNHLADTAPVTVDGGTLEMFSTETVGAVHLISGAITGTGGTFVGSSYTVESGTVERVLSGGSSALTKNGVGTVVLSGANDYAGATTVNAGRLEVSETGAIGNASAITVEGGGELRYNSATTRTGSIVLNGSGASRAVLSGEGNLGVALTLDNTGDTLSPGNSPGILTFTTAQSWDAFTYVWEINDFTGTTPGTEFDFVDIDSTLILSLEGSFLLDIVSLNASNEPGEVQNFTDGMQEWIILTATGGITGFDAENWSILTDSFDSTPLADGSWSIDHVDDSLVLSYAPIPEPSMIALVLLVGGFVWLRRKSVRS